jgi:hypothetical protein
MTTPRPTALEWIWFIGAFLFGLVLMGMIPPFQTNDEMQHWLKVESVVENQPACENIRWETVELLHATHAEQTKQRHYLWMLGSFDPAFRLHDHRPQPEPGAGGACGYPAIAYVVPALLSRAAHALWPSHHGAVLASYYAARFGNWIELTLGVLLVLLLVPVARTWTLLLYSLPMVVHQSVSVNQDSAIMALHCVLVVALFRLRGWPQLVAILVVTALLSRIKPTHAPLVLWALPALWQLTFGSGDRRQRRWRLLALGAAAALVLGAGLWRLWPWITLPRHADVGAPSWTDPGLQVWNIFHRPELLKAALAQQLRDNLRRGALTGGWTSVLGIMGWCQFALPESAYDRLLWACGLALLAALAARPGTPTLPPTRSWGEALVTRGLPALAPLFMVLLVDVAFWVLFTEPGRPAIIGVQGRYYHGALYIAGIGWASWMARRSWLAWARRELLYGLLTAATLLCLVGAWIDTVQLIDQRYWFQFP